MHCSVKWGVFASITALIAWIGGSALASAPAAGGGGEGEAAAMTLALKVPPGELEPVAVQTTSPGRKLGVALRRAGIEPDALAAAGVGTTGLGSLITRADAWFVENGEALRQSDAALGEARVLRDQLQRLVRSGLAEPEDVVALAQAKATHDAARIARDAVLHALFVAATEGMEGPRVATLAQIHDNANWKPPVHFLVEDRETATWLQLRDSLAHERIAPRFEEDPDPEVVAFLTAMRARQAVAQAHANYEAFHAALLASWQASLLQPQ